MNFMRVSLICIMSVLLGEIAAEFKKDKTDRQFDTLGGMNIYDYRPPQKYDFRDAMKPEGDKRALDTLGDMQLHGYKRALDTLGDMQLHGYKRSFDSLGGINLHSGYKRYLSSLGGTEIHGYKRSLDSLGGAFVPAYKRYLSSLGGAQIHDGFKRSMDKRYLSTLGGANVYGYKRGLDSLGGVNLHDGFKRFLSTLGGANVHSGSSSKRTFPAPGEVNVDDGFNMNTESNEEESPEKRNLDTLGGYSLHRFKRSDTEEEGSTLKSDEVKQS